MGRNSPIAVKVILRAAAPPYGGLPTRQAVIVDGPHPPVKLVTIAATLQPGSNPPAVPSTCP